MSEAPQTDVSRPSALPTAKLRTASSQQVVDQNSAEYLDFVEEEWNKKIDIEVETLVDGMVDIVGLASVSLQNSHWTTLMNPFILLTSRLATKISSELPRKHFKHSAEPNLWSARLTLFFLSHIR